MLHSRLKFIESFSEEEVHPTFPSTTRAMNDEIVAMVRFEEETICLQASERVLKRIAKYGSWLYQQEHSNYWDMSLASGWGDLLYQNNDTGARGFR